MERLLANHLRHGVGQLDLTARTQTLMFEHPHHLGLQDVPPGDNQVRRSIFALRLFDQSLDLGQRSTGAKGASARKRWKDGDAAKLYLGLSAEIMKIQFKTMAEKPPAVPVAEAKDWDAQATRFSDWVRERLAKRQ